MPYSMYSMKINMCQGYLYALLLRRLCLPIHGTDLGIFGLVSGNGSWKMDTRHVDSLFFRFACMHWSGRDFESGVSVGYDGQTDPMGCYSCDFNIPVVFTMNRRLMSSF